MTRPAPDQGPPPGSECVSATLTQTIGEYETVELRGTTPPDPGGLCNPEDRYTELGELGRGGLGVVLEVFDHDLRRAVALKRTRDDRTEPRHRAALLREAQLSAQLEHPNIVPIHGLGLDRDGRPFFTMTRLRGPSLAELLDQARTDPALASELTLPRRLRVFLQIGYAVAFAHHRGVLHRDLKPANVVIGQFGEVRVVDWGIAKLLDRPDEAATAGDGQPPLATSGAPATQEGQFVGTPGYASPEQTLGGVALDERSDVFSLGASLYELVSGRRPIEGASQVETMLKTMEGEIQPIASLAHVSDRLAAVIHKALATDREGRYPSVLALLDDVEAALEGHAVAALPEGALEKLGKWYVGRPKRLGRLALWHIDFACGGSLALGLAAGVGLALWLGQGAWAQLLVAAALIFGVAANLPFVYTMLRKDRPDDPESFLSPGEGVVPTSSRDRDSAQKSPDSR